jgi:hypothetical protein
VSRVYSSDHKCSAQLILHQSNPQSGREITTNKLSPVSPMLEALSRNVIDIANHFDVQPNSIDMEGLAPFMPHCIYQASVIQAQLVQERSDLSSRQGLHSLQKLLMRCDERWKIAGMPIFRFRKWFIRRIKLTSLVGKYYQSVEAFSKALNISD